MTTAATQSSVAAIEDRIQHRDYQAALELIRQETSLDKSCVVGRDRLALDVMTGECLAFLGRQREAVTICRKAAHALRRGDDHALFASACFSLGVADYFLGNIDEATENVNLALFSFKRVGDAAGIVRSMNWLGNIAFYRSDYRRALASYQGCAEYARKHRLQRWVAVARDNMARAYFLTGDFRKARAVFRGNRKIYVDEGDHLDELRYDLSVPYIDIQERRFKHAEMLLEQVRDAACSGSYPREQGVWCEYMGELHLAQGHTTEAVEYLEQAIAIGAASGSDESLLGQSHRLLAETRLVQGNLDESLAECERALVPIRKVGERFEEGVVFRILGEVHARRRETGEAITAFRQSIGILQMIGARLEWGKSCLAAGRCTLFSDRERLGFLFEAERLLGEVGVGYWIEQTRAALEAILTKDLPAPAQIANIRSVEQPEIVTMDAETRKTLRMAWCWAKQDMAILITGETGTGKDLLARTIHLVSPRRDRPFVSIDLNNIPEPLWESELFGYRRGTFTGASEERPGLLEGAEGGTVFLNEIGNLPLQVQAKLLEFLDTRRIRALGDTRTRALDVRFIAATNTDLQEAVNANLFRPDLYFRLGQATLQLRPLRERREDILPLLRHFLADRAMTEDDLGRLPEEPWVQRAQQEPWPGNIRQLQNFVWQLVSLAGPQLSADTSTWANCLMDHLHKVRSDNGHDVAPNPRRDMLIEALARHHWNQRAAARELDISEAGVRVLMHRWDVRRPDEDASKIAA